MTTDPNDTLSRYSTHVSREIAVSMNDYIASRVSDDSLRDEFRARSAEVRAEMEAEPPPAVTEEEARRGAAMVMPAMRHHIAMADIELKHWPASPLRREELQLRAEALRRGLRELEARSAA